MSEKSEKIKCELVPYSRNTELEIKNKTEHYEPNIVHGIDVDNLRWQIEKATQARKRMKPGDQVTIDGTNLIEQ